MREFNMLKDFISQIPQNSKIVILGAGICGQAVKKEIDLTRPDIKILYFVDSYKEGKGDGLEIVNTARLDELKDKFDLLVCATRTELYALVEIFRLLNLNYITIPYKLEQDLRVKQYAESKDKAAAVFKDEKDRELYNLIWDAKVYKDCTALKTWAYKTHGIGIESCFRNYNVHYTEFVNKDAVKVIFYGGYFDGAQALSFPRQFKNLEVVYVFEPMYEKFKNKVYDKFIKKTGLYKIIEKGLYDKEAEVMYEENLNCGGSSRIASNPASTSKDCNYLNISTTSIDCFKKENKISKIDFIKMDIEGAELPALKGGINTIITDRPQLAISIYHSFSDFINIPIWMYENLKDYTFRLGHYHSITSETVIYAIPDELYNCSTK